jgi:hypothetical protein
MLVALVVGLLIGFLLGRISGNQEEAAPPAPPARTVTVEKTLPATTLTTNASATTSP